MGEKGGPFTPPSVPSPPRDTGIRKGEITQPHTHATTHTHMHCDSNLSASPLSKAAVATGVCCKLKTQQGGWFRSSTHHFSKRLLHFVVCRRFCDPRVVNHPNVSSLSAGVFFFLFFFLVLYDWETHWRHSSLSAPAVAAWREVDSYSLSVAPYVQHLDSRLLIRSDVKYYTLLFPRLSSLILPCLVCCASSL